MWGSIRPWWSRSSFRSIDRRRSIRRLVRVAGPRRRRRRRAARVVWSSGWGASRGSGTPRARGRARSGRSSRTRRTRRRASNPPRRGWSSRCTRRIQPCARFARDDATGEGFVFFFRVKFRRGENKGRGPSDVDTARSVSGRSCGPRGSAVTSPRRKRAESALRGPVESSPESPRGRRVTRAGRVDQRSSSSRRKMRERLESRGWLLLPGERRAAEPARGGARGRRARTPLRLILPHVSPDRPVRHPLARARLAEGRR